MKLVVQSAEALSDNHIDSLATLAQAASSARIDAHAIRIGDANPAQRGAIADYCNTHRLDWAFVPLHQLADFELLAIDMDSTLITIESIDEIADFCGLKAEVAAITEASMRGELGDFDASLKRRVALLAGLEASVLERVYTERLQLSPGAEALFVGARAAGWRTLLISGGFTFFTERLRERLGLDFTRANTLEIVNGRLTGHLHGEIVNAEVKARTLLETCGQLNIDPQRAIAIGDGSNDLKMISTAGFSVAFRAKPIVREAAHAALDYAGLDGVLRYFD